ncbi:MAG: hypothetical protein ACK4GM_01705 [Tabrizicola sp.]
MGMITSIRAPFPVAEAPTQPAGETRPARSDTAGGIAAVAAPVRTDAVTQAPARQAATPQQLLTRATTETSAAAAAEAARQAYIKASIAAGISPLPLP